jgi:carboxylesterase
MEGGEEAVLVIHGYTGIPDELRYFAQRLYEAGYTVVVPRLPGHGTNETDFLSSTAQDWYRKVVDTYLISPKHSHSLGGLSMGALLAILGASQFSAEKSYLPLRL